jgi:hypothetical protein
VSDQIRLARTPASSVAAQTATSLTVGGPDGRGSGAAPGTPRLVTAAVRSAQAGRVLGAHDPMAVTTASQPSPSAVSDTAAMSSHRATAG